MNHTPHFFRRLVFPLVIVFAIVCSPTSVNAQSRKAEARWVDSVMSTLTLEQQVAQLIVMRVPSKMKPADEKKFIARLERTRVGGICFFAGNAEDQLRKTKLFQNHAFVPLMVCIDGEWGLGMRLKDCYSFPRQNIFGTLPPQADTLVYSMASEIGRQCRKMGINVNFAPVVDVNSNPDNPVIGTRAFSDSPERTARLGLQYMRGLQDQGIMAVAKHFPGHGDTKTDSHKELPVISHDYRHLDSVELYPFRRLINEGIWGIMTAHLSIPALDSIPHRPSSLSEPIITQLLREEMKFDGLVFTDGLDMKAVSNHYMAGDAAVQAIRAGNDILLIPADVETCIKALLGEASIDDAFRYKVRRSCRRVLAAKYRMGLSRLDLDALSVPDREDSIRCATLLQGIRLNQDPRIDSVLLSGISQRAYPGCQMVVMQHGQVIYRRAYGDYVYDDSVACHVTPTTMYDLASLTKVTATTLAIMKLVDNRVIALDDPLAHYLPYLRETNKKHITIRKVLSHNARLKPFDSYWYMSNDPEEIIRLIAESPLQKQEKYLYSDLGFILLGDLVRQVSGLTLDRFMARYFYNPMQLQRTCFRPLEHGFDLDDMAPTEDEMQYRNRLIHGIVHDPNAYALGGVAGHAGLFSTADEVGALMQLLLNGGVYQGKRLLSESIIDTFNTRHYVAQGNRRALGFDKPLIKDPSTHVAPEASQSSFGHTGFTGTMVWADPQYDLVYVFLSNRVCPSASPNRLALLDIRTNLQSLIYQDLNLTPQALQSPQPPILVEPQGGQQAKAQSKKSQQTQKKTQSKKKSQSKRKSPRKKSPSKKK